MPNYYKNWKFRDVGSFLKDHGFHLHHTNGSHFYYLDAKMRMVCVPFHGGKAIKPRTMKGIMLQSGIDAREWFGR